jgi:hypothetical protein
MIKKDKITTALMTVFFVTALTLTACSSSNVSDMLSSTTATESTTDQAEPSSGKELSESVTNTQDENLSSSSASASSDTLLDTSDLFSERDLEQEADLTDAYYMTLESGENISITQEGVYVISGTATDVTITVEAADTDKVQIVLDGASITNTTSPAIYVKSADKVFVTTDGTSTLKVTGTFTADGTTNLDAVIYSKSDLVLNGTGTLNIESSANGISAKDDLKVTGGTYNITATEDAVEANDSIRIYDGTFDITSKKDAFHSENSDDNTLGYVYIQGGTFKINATDDGIQATTVLMIDGGTFDITAAEGLEATYAQINNGTITIEASDDGINATQKSTAYDVVIEVNGGDITVNMGAGDTDGFDANGNIYINGGTISVTGNSAFDWDGEALLNGGTVTVNGEEVTELTNQMMGGMGGFGGGPGGMGGQMPNGEMPEGFDGQMPQDGQMPEGGQMPNGQFPGGGKGGRMNGQMPNNQNTTESSSSSSQG